MSCQFSLSLSFSLIYVQALAAIPATSCYRTVEDLVPAAASGCLAQLFEQLSWFLLRSACSWNFLSCLGDFSLWLTLNYLEFMCFHPMGETGFFQLLLSTCIDGPCSWSIGRIPICLHICVCFLQEKHTKIYSHPEAIAHLQSTCWDCEYKRRNFCKDGCKFLKICFVSELSNYTSRNFLYCVVFFWI